MRLKNLIAMKIIEQFWKLYYQNSYQIMQQYLLILKLQNSPGKYYYWEEEHKLDSQKM